MNQLQKKAPEERLLAASKKIIELLKIPDIPLYSRGMREARMELEVAITIFENLDPRIRELLGWAKRGNLFKEGDKNESTTEEK